MIPAWSGATHPARQGHSEPGAGYPQLLRLPGSDAVFGGVMSFSLELCEHAGGPGMAKATTHRSTAPSDGFADLALP